MNYTLMHEHMLIDLAKIKGNDDCRLDCRSETIKELKELYQNGVRNIVEVTNRGIGRDVDYINDIARETNINIILSTGYYKDPFLPDEVEKLSIKELADIMIMEIEHGIEGSDIKASIIGEIGTSLNKMTILEEKVFRASALAQLKTNVPITTHTTLGTYAKEQITLFKDMNVDLEKVIIGHVDLCGDEDYIEDLLNEGVYVEFDTIGKISYLPDETRADILASLIKKGWEEKIVMSMDITRKSHLKYLGGVGYSYIFDTFIPMLRERGVEASSILQILEKNPKKLLGI